MNNARRTLPLLEGTAIFGGWAIGTIAIWTAWLLPASLLILWAAGPSIWWPFGALLGLAGIPGCIVWITIIHD